MNYFEYLNKLIENNEECRLCDKKVQTLHHRDENRNNNTFSNWLPVCFNCHSDLKHERSVYDYGKDNNFVPRDKPKSCFSYYEQKKLNNNICNLNWTKELKEAKLKEYLGVTRLEVAE